jgi:hypothetical protein
LVSDVTNDLSEELVHVRLAGSEVGLVLTHDANEARDATSHGLKHPRFACGGVQCVVDVHVKLDGRQGAVGGLRDAWVE